MLGWLHSQPDSQLIDEYHMNNGTNNAETMRRTIQSLRNFSSYVHILLKISNIIIISSRIGSNENPLRHRKLYF